MVEKFTQILQQIEEKHGNVYLFAILQMDELIDKWTIILSAPWIRTDVQRSDAFEEIRQLMIGKLTQEELSSVARLGIMPREEHLIGELLKFTKGAEIKDQKINGNIVHRGFIIESSSNPVLT